MRVPRPELTRYKKLMAVWALTQKDMIEKIKHEIKPDDFMIWNIIQFLPHEKMYTKSGNPKKMDILNWQKGVIDCLCSILDRDDSRIYAIDFRREVTENHAHYDVMIRHK